MSQSDDGGSAWSRRDFLSAAAATTGGIAVARKPRAEPLDSGAAKAPAPPAARDRIAVTLRVNGLEHRLELDPRTTLLDAVRDHVGLPGTKKGCDMGACGACTVHVAGRRVVSCLTLAASVDGKEITTIEGLAQNGALHPVQAAFLEHDGFQCGYCTPGQIMSAVALIREGRATSPEAIREFMSGNICRCGAYPNIVDAISDASGRA